MWLTDYLWSIESRTFFYIGVDKAIWFFYFYKQILIW